MKKIFCLIAVISLILSLFACQKTPEAPDTEAKGGDLADDGMKVISLMADMISSEDYGLMMLNNYADYVERINDIRRGSYEAPQAVYEIKMDTRRILNSDAEGLPESLKEYVGGMTNASVAAYINSAESLDGVAVSSLFSATIAFVNENVKENTMYFYVFDSDYPILVNFICGEDGAVRASGNFIMNAELNPGSADGIEEFFKKAGFSDCEVSKVR